MNSLNFNQNNHQINNQTSHRNANLNSNQNTTHQNSKRNSNQSTNRNTNENTQRNFHKILHQKILGVATQFKKCESELIKLLGEVDQHKTFRQFGYTSLFDYSVKALGLSESVSYVYISVARKCLEVPALKKQIDQGAISVTQARKITPVLTAANQDDLLTLAQNLSARKLEKEIATLYPKAATVEHIKYTSGKRLALQCGVSEELMLKLRRIQDLESTRQRKNINLEEALEAMVKVYLHHKDPLEKAKRQKARGKLLLKSSTKKDQSSNLNNSIDINGLNYSKHLNALNNSIDLNNLNNSKHSSNLKQSHLKQPQNKTIISKTSNKLPDSSQVQLLQIPQISSQIPENSQLPQASKVTSQLHQGPQSPERPQSSQKPGSGPARVKKLNQKVSTRIIKRSIKESIKRTPIPARIVHTVWLRDNNQCAFTDQNGKKCTNKRYLEIHHRVPVVNGGLNTPDNLTVLCSAHHKMHHLFNLLPAIN